jgi:hypothetical protein
VIFSEPDLKIVQELLVPTLGTETLAPLLHFLVRFIRAKNVLEGGAGYTTPFLAMALATNQSDFLRELQELKQKTRTYLAEVNSIIQSDPRSQVVDAPADEAHLGLDSLYGRKASRLAEKRFEWLEGEPAWARPSYYSQTYEPNLVSLDNFSHQDSSASRVRKVVEGLGLSQYVTFKRRDFWKCKPQTLLSKFLPFDLIWIDLPVNVRGLVNLLQGDYWNCLRSDGGLLAIHDMMTTRGGQLLINELKRYQKNGRFSDFEFTGFLEPNRLMQGDFILIQKTSARRIDPVDDLIQQPGRGILEEESQMLLELYET